MLKPITSPCLPHAYTQPIHKPNSDPSHAQVHSHPLLSLLPSNAHAHTHVHTHLISPCPYPCPFLCPRLHPSCVFVHSFAMPFPSHTLVHAHPLHIYCTYHHLIPMPIPFPAVSSEYTPTHLPPILMTFILPLFTLGQCYAYAISILFLCPCNLPTHVCSHLMLMSRSMHPYHVVCPHLQPSHTRIHNRVHIYLMLIPSLCPCYIHTCLCHDYSFPTSMSTPMFISSHCPYHIHVDPFSFPHHACAYGNICLLPIPMLISTSIYSLCPFPL